MKYGLNDNPFKERFDHEIVGDERHRTLEQVCLLVERCSRVPAKNVKGDRALAVVNGTYGLGKTFTLWYLQNRILKDASLRKKFFKKHPDLKIACARFRLLEGGKLGSKPFLYLYKNIMYNLGGEHEGRTFVNALHADILAGAKKKGKSPDSYLSILRPPFAEVILAAGRDGPLEYLATQWLLGTKLKAKEMEELGVKYNIDSDKQAEQALEQVVKMLALAEYNALLVLADEAEDVMSAGRKAMMQYFITLRNMWDIAGEQMSRGENAAPLVVLSAFSPEAWQLVEESAEKDLGKTGGAGFQPLLTRINENIFHLSPLSTAEAQELVELLIKQERDKPRKDALYPFTPDSIDCIRDTFSGNPRKIIGLCSKALLEAEKENATKIDREFVMALLENQGTYEASAEPVAQDDSYSREI